MGKCFGKAARKSDPTANDQELASLTPSTAPKGNYTPSREERKPVNQVKKAIMGADVSKQRLDAATKTGIYTIAGKESREFPKDCLKVANLRVLSLDQCDLQEVSPEIGAVVSLQKLILPNNKLRSLPPQLSALVSLQQIDLRCNLLSSLPDCFSAMQKLKELVLANNNLQTLPESLSAAKSLKLLDVSNNKLAALPACVGDLVSLEDLDCSSNLLARLPESMGGMTRLKRVNACHNKLATGSIPGGLLRNTPIDSLRIQGNPIPSLEGEDGYSDYAQRAKTHELKNIDQRVRTGDLSQGLGTAEQYAAMRKG